MSLNVKIKFSKLRNLRIPKPYKGVWNLRVGKDQGARLRKIIMRLLRSEL